MKCPVTAKMQACMAEPKTAACMNTFLKTPTPKACQSTWLMVVNPWVKFLVVVKLLMTLL